MTDQTDNTDDPDEQGLEFREGHGVSRIEELAHKLGWVVLAALLLAALAGLLGPGPLSSRTAEVSPALSVEYQRFLRNHAPADLHIRVVPPPGGGNTIRLHVGNAFLEATELTRITPGPDAVEVTPEGHVYVFAAPDLGASQALILYHFEPDAAFSDIPARIGLEGGPEVSFRQFVYP